MKIWYKKITRSVNIDELALFNKIHATLNKGGYESKNLASNRIKFNGDIVEWEFSHIKFRRIDGGVFELNQEGKRELSLSYYISPIQELLACLITVIIGVCTHEYMMCIVFPSFLVIGFSIRAIVTANIAVNMMDNILPEQETERYSTETSDKKVY